jgi:hypothetical protein
MKSIQLFAATFLFCLALAICERASFAANATLIDNASDPDRALITFPDYSVSPPGKWTIVVLKEKSLRFRSMDGAQNMQAGTVDLHPKSDQTEDDAFHEYVDKRRQQEHENIDNKALKADAIDYSSNERGRFASWCIIDPAGAGGHLTAVLENKRKLLVVSYDVDKVIEAEFRKRAAMVTSSMTLR